MLVQFRQHQLKACSEHVHTELQAESTIHPNPPNKAPNAKSQLAKGRWRGRGGERRGSRARIPEECRLETTWSQCRCIAVPPGQHWMGSRASAPARPATSLFPTIPSTLRAMQAYQAHLAGTALLPSTIQHALEECGAGTEHHTMGREHLVIATAQQHVAEAGRSQVGFKAVRHKS
jgi:hypothetical protein